MITTILSDTKTHMHKSIEALKNDFTKIRTGRAHPSLLDQVRVDYYGTLTPLSQVANVATLDAQTLSVTPWEKALVPAIEKAIATSNLGLNPSNNGGVIRVPMPVLTEERRRELVKVVRAESENAKVSVRNVRRDGISQLKTLEKDKEISEDELRKAETDIQKLTDDHTKQVDSLMAEKETELMSV